MALYSLIGRRIEDLFASQFPSGVTRFDASLRAVFPQMQSVTPERGLPTFTPDDVVIADNHLSVLVPETTPCIVVLHGCARTHYERDPAWRSPTTAAMCQGQEEMLHVKHRLFVAPSRWVRSEFCRWYDLPEDFARMLIHWVPPTVRQPPKNQRPVVMGDWRDTNKGLFIWPHLAEMLPQYEFRQLNCRTDAERAAAYQEADVFLCLSLSEGGAYVCLDAEAAAMPVVTTPVGMCFDFPWWYVLSDVSKRAWFAEVAALVDQALAATPRASFYERYTFGQWSLLWHAAVEDAQSC